MTINKIFLIVSQLKCDFFFFFFFFFNLQKKKIFDKYFIYCFQFIYVLSFFFVYIITSCSILFFIKNSFFTNLFIHILVFLTYFFTCLFI